MLSVLKFWSEAVSMHGWFQKTFKKNLNARLVLVKEVMQYIHYVYTATQMH